MFLGTDAGERRPRTTLMTAAHTKSALLAVHWLRPAGPTLVPRSAIRFVSHVSAHTLSTMSFTIGASPHARALKRANIAHPRETRTAFARPVPS